MNYKMNVKEWKEIIQDAAHNTHIVYNKPYLVMDINQPFNDWEGEGPFNMAFAYRDSENNRWMSYEFQGKEISYYDFRDANTHDVGGHSGRVSHVIDAYELSVIVLDLLTENENLKEKINKLK